MLNRTHCWFQRGFPPHTLTHFYCCRCRMIACLGIQFKLVHHFQQSTKLHGACHHSTLLPCSFFSLPETTDHHPALSCQTSWILQPSAEKAHCAPSFKVGLWCRMLNGTETLALHSLTLAPLHSQPIHAKSRRNVLDHQNPLQKKWRYAFFNHAFLLRRHMF